MKLYSIGVDLGATNTKIGFVKNEKIVFRSSFQTPKNAEEIASSIAREITILAEKNGINFEEILGIGIGCPGVIASKDGFIASLTNLNMQSFDFAKAVRDETKKLGLKSEIKIRLINDADAAAIAEHSLGAGKGYKHMIMLTLGSGIGGGIIIGGELYEGIGAAGELGHMIIEPQGRKCGCGGRGCFEAYASVSALINRADIFRKQSEKSSLSGCKNLDGKTIFESYLSGDTAAKKAVDEFVYYLSLGITSIINIFRPQIIVIGGGVSMMGEELIGLINQELKQSDGFLKKASLPEIVHAKYYNDAGILGAALIAE